MHCPGRVGRNCYRAADGGTPSLMCMYAFDLMFFNFSNTSVAPTGYILPCDLTGRSLRYGDRGVEAQCTRKSHN